MWMSRLGLARRRGAPVPWHRCSFRLESSVVLMGCLYQYWLNITQLFRFDVHQTVNYGAIGLALPN